MTVLLILIRFGTNNCHLISLFYMFGISHFFINQLLDSLFVTNLLFDLSTDPLDVLRFYLLKFVKLKCLSKHIVTFQRFVYSISCRNIALFNLLTVLKALLVSLAHSYFRYKEIFLLLFKTHVRYFPRGSFDTLIQQIS